MSLFIETMVFGNRRPRRSLDNKRKGIRPSCFHTLSRLGTHGSAGRQPDARQPQPAAVSPSAPVGNHQRSTLPLKTPSEVRGSVTLGRAAGAAAGLG